MLEQLRSALEALQARRAEAIAEMETMQGALEADEERAAFTADEDTRFTGLVGEVRGIDAQAETVEEQIADLEAIEARSDMLAKRAPVNVNRGLTRDDPYGEVRSDITTQEARGRVERALELSHGITDDEREVVLDKVRQVDQGSRHENRAARLVLMTGSPEYRSGFTKLLEGNGYALTGDEARAVEAVRAASLTGNAGGFAVPYTIDPTIIDTRAGTVNPMRELATVKSITTNKWTGVSSAGVSASWDGEAAQVSDDAPTLAQPVIEAYKAQAFVPFSIEVGEDWEAMEQDVRMMFANAKDDLEAAAHFVGDGSNKPQGIVDQLDGTASEVAAAVAETFSSVDLYAVEQALPARHRARASWTANKAIYNLVRQFADNNDGDLWVRLGAAQPAELLGYQAYEASAMDAGFDAAATADNFLAILGDFSQYYIVDRIGMNVELVPHLVGANQRPTGQRGLYAYWRTGGEAVNIDAFRMLNVATAA